MREGNCYYLLAQAGGLGRAKCVPQDSPFTGVLIAQLVKNPPAMQETLVRFLGWEEPLDKGKAPHSSILAWRIPWTEYSMGSQRVGHN